MGEHVPAVLTRIGPPWDHHAIVVRFDGILRSCGVTSPTVRRRMTIGMITGSGWKQKCWNHNFNKIKIGSGWTGPFWVGDTKEEKDGVEYTEKGTKWRSYPSWRAAVADWHKVTSQPWRKARPLLTRDDISDGDWWAAMKADRWFTGTGIDPVHWGNSIGKRVKAELASATPTELAAALQIPVDGGPGGVIASVILLAAVVVGWYLVNR